MVPTVWLVVPMVYVMTIIIEDIRFHRIQGGAILQLTQLVTLQMLTTSPSF